MIRPLSQIYYDVDKEERENEMRYLVFSKKDIAELREEKHRYWRELKDTEKPISANHVGYFGNLPVIEDETFGGLKNDGK